MTVKIFFNKNIILCQGFLLDLKPVAKNDLFIKMSQYCKKSSVTNNNGLTELWNSGFPHYSRGVTEKFIPANIKTVKLSLKWFPLFFDIIKTSNTKSANNDGHLVSTSKHITRVFLVRKSESASRSFSLATFWLWTQRKAAQSTFVRKICT